MAIKLTVSQPAPVSLSYVEAAIKPEVTGHITPTYEEQTVYPAAGTTFGRVDVDPIPDPTAIKEIGTNGDHDVRRYGTARVSVTPTLQTKEVTPTKQTQTVVPDPDKDGLSAVEVNPIPSQYIIPEGSLNITQNANGIDVTDKASVNVNVPIPPEYIIPTGTKTITENGTGINIREFERVDVDISPVGWLLDNYVGGYPTRARFFPSSTLTDTGDRVFNKHSYDSVSVLKKLTDVEFMAGTTRIGNYVCYNCDAIENITMHEGLLTLGSNAFEYAKITSLIIPSTVTNYGEYYCRNCSNLEYIEYKGNCRLGYYLFAGSVLKQIICRGNVSQILPADFPSTMELYDFSNCTDVPSLTAATTIKYGAGTVIRIPSGLHDRWITATNWCDLPTDTSLDAYIVWEDV